MLLANYGSDSDSDDSGPSSPPLKRAPVTAPAPAPKAGVVKKRKPVKIGLGIEPVEKDKVPGKGRSATPDAEVEEDRGAGGKRKLGGAGSSALLGMLPPPKRKLPSTGLGGKMGLTTPGQGLGLASRPAVARADNDDDAPAFVPKVVKKKADENIDLFGLSDAVSKPALPTPSTIARPTNLSSAPPVSEFIPPVPTPSDPYPGYYQLPSGAWAAHDPAYYARITSSPSYSASNALEAEEDRKTGRVGRDWAALDDGRADVLDINASDGLAAARAEQERQARLSKPKAHDEFEYKPIGQTKGLAQERHQLSSLLNSAYSQREELEARIAENKKNMRNAKTKYGF